MSRHDSCHDQVADALRQEGWLVENELKRFYKKRFVNLDLRAYREGQHAFIEVKCFPNSAIADEQYTAIGQHLTYRTFLRLVSISDPLFLAVPVAIYETKFDDLFLETITEYRINLLIFDISGKKRITWIAY